MIDPITTEFTSFATAKALSERGRRSQTPMKIIHFQSCVVPLDLKQINYILMKISKKKLGVWMDHTIAHIIEIKNNKITSNTIESLSLQGEKQNFGKDESLKHNTEQDQLSEYFKRISNVI